MSFARDKATATFAHMVVGVERKAKSREMAVTAGLCGLLLTVTSGLAAPADSEKTVTMLEHLRTNYDLPALAVVAVKDGAICDRAATGVRKWGDPTPVTTNDVFHIGSCTKSMTATVVGRVIDTGKLRWNSTIGEAFPELKGRMNPQYEGVTVEQLLTHRGGVPHDPPAAAWQRAWEKRGSPTEQRAEFVAAILHEPPEAPPGAKKIYSNQGYAILGAMLERITGKPWEKLMTEELFTPLGMTSAGFGIPGTIGKVDEPWGHQLRQDVIIPVQADNPPAIGPGGTVHCSLDDLARFAIFHLNGNDRAKLLQPETFRKLHTPPAGSDYACGWVVLHRNWAGGTALMHNGSNTMWYVVMWLAPAKNFAVIAATNIAGEKAEKGCDEAVGALIHKWLQN